MIQITGPRFSAWVIINRAGQIVEVAPFLKRYLYPGQDMLTIERRCRNNGWKAEVIAPPAARRAP